MEVTQVIDLALKFSTIGNLLSNSLMLKTLYLPVCFISAKVVVLSEIFERHEQPSISSRNPRNRTCWSKP